MTLRTEVARERLRWDRRSCQQYAYLDAHLPLLTQDEQRPIYEEVIETLLMKVITAAVRAQGDIVLCSATTGLAALNHEGGTIFRILSLYCIRHYLSYFP